MIEIFYDHLRLETGEKEDIEIKEDDQYESCLQKIEEYAKTGRHLKIYVRNRGMYGWFDSVKCKYGGIVKTIGKETEKCHFFKTAKR